MRSREILFGLFLSLSMTVSAQTDTLSIPSTEEVYRQNYWLTGTNPVGLSFNRFRSFSVAEASYSHHKGNFGNVSIPASADIYSVYSESFQTVDKVSIYGKIGYTQFQNRQQNWNGMTGDYWQAVNLCDSISGKQRSEEYQLAGGFSLPVHPRWLLGAKADYRVQLTAKDTDPRNKNQWMEWRLTPGVGYLYGNLHLGASLLYVRRKETVNYQNMGSHTTYPVLVAYPLGFFKTLSWGENVNWYYSGQEVGGALQLHFNRGSFQLYQDISGSAAWQTVESDRIKNKKEGKKKMIAEILKSILFGVVEGITEWLPISSTGHLILVEQFVKLKEVSPEFWGMFQVVIQFGAILAVVLLYWNKIWPFTQNKKEAIKPTGVLSYLNQDTMILWAKILVACVPAAVIGVFFDEVFEELFYNPFCIAIALIVFGIAFIVVENFNQKRDNKKLKEKEGILPKI